MDVVATRLENLQILVANLTKEGQHKKQAAVALDMSASFLSQLLGGKKMGDDVARKIELALGLAHGWMDVRQGGHVSDAESPVYSLSQGARWDAETLAAAIKLVRLTFENLGFEHDPEEDAVPIVHAYDYLLESRQRSVTPENLVDFSKRLAEKLRNRGNDDEHQGGKSGSAGGSDRLAGKRLKAN